MSGEDSTCPRAVVIPDYRMTSERQRMVESLVHAIPTLTSGQLHWLDRVVQIFKSPHKFDLRNSDFFDREILQNFGDAMRVHHCFSAEPFTKDKFEYVLVSVLRLAGHQASLAPKGNPGHDATVDGIRVSLKTQADKSLKDDEIWISKYMELGKGIWGGKTKDLEGLRSQFLSHLEHYDRIFSLRALRKAPEWKYELVEIPRELLLRAREGTLKIVRESSQNPKPGYCSVFDEGRNLIFELYFDAGTERKLQIKKLKKSGCSVHATWEFVIQPE